MGLWNLFEGKTIKKYKERVEKNPGEAEAHFYLAAAYEQKGCIREAIKEFKEAVRINPRSAEANFNLGVLYAKVDDGRNAILHILKAGNLFGEKGDALSKEKARKRLRDYYQKYGFKPEDFSDGKKDP